MIGTTVVKAQAEEAGLYRDYHGQRYWLCCDTCSALFDANPAEYASPSGAATRPELTTTEDTTMDLTPPPDTSTDECHTTHGYITDKDRYLARLKRIEGQARGIQRMVDEEQYCIDILTQISALTSALRNVGLGLLDDHLKHCVVDAAKHGGEAADAKIKEATDAIARLVRS